ncbi:hypothetical protein MRB53_020380 [Persea americana]|uniref:Uncharacterized protein n=1 Tax=Persea americana TaxID=3435 RepID=A0ACC2L235_PERAE|nr:hypothetical protein MRB53_020380 [Persea americana]
MRFRSLRLSRLVFVAPTSPEKEVVIASAALTGNRASSKAGGVAIFRNPFPANFNPLFSLKKNVKQKKVKGKEKKPYTPLPPPQPPKSCYSQAPGLHHITSSGVGFKPKILDMDVLEGELEVTTEDAVKMAR